MNISSNTKPNQYISGPANADEAKEILSEVEREAKSFIALDQDSVDLNRDTGRVRIETGQSTVKLNYNKGSEEVTAYARFSQENGEIKEEVALTNSPGGRDLRLNRDGNSVYIFQTYDGTIMAYNKTPSS